MRYHDLSMRILPLAILCSIRNGIFSINTKLFLCGFTGSMIVVALSIHFLRRGSTHISVFIFTNEIF